MSVLLPAIVPVSFIVFLGFVVKRTLNIEAQTLSVLTIYLLFPALIATSLAEATLSLESSTQLVSGFLLSSALLYLLALGCARVFQLSSDLHKSLIATTLFSNTGNLGLPFISFTLGEMGLERAVVYLVAASILMSSVGPALLKGAGFSFGLRYTLQLPLFWAMVGGLLLRAWSVQLPLNLDRGIAMVGNAAIPIALITLGMQLSQTRLEFRLYELLATGMRLLGGPIVAYGVGISLGLNALDLQVLVLEGAMPTAITSLIWAQEFGGDPQRVANTIVLSTLLSLLTLPLILWLSS